MGGSDSGWLTTRRGEKDPGKNVLRTGVDMSPEPVLGLNKITFGHQGSFFGSALNLFCCKNNFLIKVMLGVRPLLRSNTA